MPYAASGNDKVSIIIVVNDDEDLAARIEETRHEMECAGCDSEVMLVGHRLGNEWFSSDSRANEEEPATTQVGQRVPCFPCLSDAINHATHRQVAIVDSESRLTACTWNLLKKLDPETVRLSIDVPKPSSSSKRFWLMLLSLVTRLLLKTRKTECTPGVTLFRANQIRHFVSHLQGVSPREDVVRLLALARQQGQASTELITYRRPVSHAAPLASDQGTSGPVGISIPKSKVIRASVRSAVRFWFRQIMFPVNQLEIASPKPKKKNEVLLVLGLIVAATVLLFSGIGFPLLEPDEVRNAQIALNIEESGVWSALMLRNEHYWDKPPLQHWAIAVSHAVFGPSAWSTRFPIALASFMTVMVTFFVGKRLFGFRAAWIAAICLLLTIGFLLISRYTAMDATLTMTVTAAMLFGLLSLRGLGDRQTFRADYAMLASLAVGLGLMVKGPVIVALCLPPLLLASWFLKQDRFRQGKLVSDSRSTPSSRPALSVRWRWLCYLLPATMVAAPWFVWVSLFYPDFLTEFIWRHNVMRFANGFNHQQPFYFYLVVIFVVMFPVSYLFPSAIKFLTTRNRQCQRKRSRELGLLVICVTWVFVFFSISTSKLVTYIVPAFPLICLVLGVVLEQQMVARLDTAKTFLAGLVKRSCWELPAWSIVIALITIFAFKTPWAKVVPWSVVCLGLGVLAWYARRQFLPHRARRTAWISMAGMSAVLAIMVSQIVFPAVAEKRSDQLAVANLLKMRSESLTRSTPVSNQVNEGNFNSTKVVYVGRDSFAASMYVDPEQVIHFEFGEVEQAAAFLKRTPHSIVVSSGETLERLKAILEGDPRNSVDIEKSPLGRHVFWVHTNPMNSSPASLNRQAKKNVDEHR